MDAVPVQNRRVPLRQDGLQDRLHLPVLLLDRRYFHHHHLPVHGVRPRLRRPVRAGIGQPQRRVRQRLPATVPRGRQRHRLRARSGGPGVRHPALAVLRAPLRQRGGLLHLRAEPVHRRALRGIQCSRGPGGGALLPQPGAGLLGEDAAAAVGVRDPEEQGEGVLRDGEHRRRGVVAAAELQQASPQHHSVVAAHDPDRGRPGAAEAPLGGADAGLRLSDVHEVGLLFQDKGAPPRPQRRRRATGRGRLRPRRGDSEQPGVEHSHAREADGGQGRVQQRLLGWRRREEGRAGQRYDTVLHHVVPEDGRGRQRQARRPQRAHGEARRHGQEVCRRG
mmetsp:Transcript_44440/g.117480  ORF Transcript_44440/g.117480 Transcript_44440/m.117480 type:complete len:335 (-) Transcript_44440:539-1543(-)